MQRTPDARSRDSDHRLDIRLEQIKIIYSAVPLSVIAILINSTILSSALWDVIPPATNLAWLLGTYSISVYRWLIYRSFKAASPESLASEDWLRSLVVGTLISGALWGSASIFLFPPDSMLHQVLLAFVIAGMSAGAVTTLSSVFHLSAAFLLLTLTPLIWRFVTAADATSHVMAIMSTLFALMVIVSSRRLNNTIMETLQIRHERRQAERTIRYQALYDELTDLPNRRLLLKRLEQEMTRSVRHSHMGAVLILDLDHFKTINDSLGHRVGDKLLKLVAMRIQSRIRAEDTAGRLGGDEFVVLIPEVGDAPGIAASNTQKVALELLDQFRRSFTIEDHELHLSASIGIALFPMDQRSPEDLLQQADVAMYSAKERGRDNTQIFLPSMQAAVDQRLQVDRGLRQAIGNGELEIYYQPQVLACRK